MKHLMTLCLSVGLLGACAGSDIQEVTDWEPQLRAANDALLNQGNLDMVPQFFAESYVAHVQAPSVDSQALAARTLAPNLNCRLSAVTGSCVARRCPSEQPGKYHDLSHQ